MSYRYSGFAVQDMWMSTVGLLPGRRVSGLSGPQRSDEKAWWDDCERSSERCQVGVYWAVRRGAAPGAKVGRKIGLNSAFQWGSSGLRNWRANGFLIGSGAFSLLSSITLVRESEALIPSLSLMICLSLTLSLPLCFCVLIILTETLFHHYNLMNSVALQCNAHNLSHVNNTGEDSSIRRLLQRDC